MLYSCRARRFSPAGEFELRDDRLVLNGVSSPIDIPFASISSITVFKEKRFGSSHRYWAATIVAGGRSYDLTAAHRVGLMRIEDRTESYIPFAKAFERAAQERNPGIAFINDEFRETASSKLFGAVSRWSLGILGRLPRKQAGAVCGAAMRLVGPWLRGHRYARRQLQAAFPEMSQGEVRSVLRAMWDNFGRTFGEYPHIPELMRFSAKTPRVGPVIMDERTAAAVLRLGSETQGALMFAAHLGNWEIPAMVAQTAGRKIALIYKRQPSSAITAQLVESRSNFAARLIEATPAAPREMIGLIRDGWLVGMLVDQHQAGGVEVDFFGHRCQINSMLARLARSRGCPVYGARVVREDDQRHRFELVGPLEFPRDASGKIEVQGAMQQVMSVIEGWIREHPGQWMWMHRIIR